MALAGKNLEKIMCNVAQPKQTQKDERVLVPSVRAPGVIGEVLGQKRVKVTCSNKAEQK